MSEDTAMCGAELPDGGLCANDRMPDASGCEAHPDNGLVLAESSRPGGPPRDQRGRR